MIYLDNAATTRLSERALAELMRVSQETYGNPSSIHQFGRLASQTLRQARDKIARVLDTKPNHIIFTSGGTEANNLAIIGYALANKDKGNHLITTAIEHHAVLHPMAFLEEKHGFEITYIQPRPDGTIDPTAIKEALRPDTLLVSTMYANNETGYLLPIREIGQILKDHPAVFHVDAVQVIGKLPVHPETLGIDMLSASGHKFHGPKGVGFLYTTTNRLQKQLQGGDQEDKRRASTENLASISAMAVALEESLSEHEQSLSHVAGLRQQLLSELEISPSQINQAAPEFPYVLNLAFPGQLNERLLMKLDLTGYAVSSGSACTAGNIEPSHVLEAIYGKNSPRLKESIRISFSKYTTSEEVASFTKQLQKLLGE